MNTHPTTKLVNQDQPMTLFGEKTPRAVIYKSESNKLHQAFCVKENKVIHQGMPVALDTMVISNPISRVEMAARFIWV